MYRIRHGSQIVLYFPSSLCCEIFQFKEIIYFIVNRFQINKLKNIVHDIDESAFISLQEVADIIRKKE